MARCRVGDPAPDFTLPGWYDGQHRRYRLADHRGRPVVLTFHPSAGDAIWARQLGEYGSELAVMNGTDALVWGITGEDVTAAAGFAGRYGIKLPLLADAKGTVGRLYGFQGLEGVDGVDGSLDGAGPHRMTGPVLVVDGRGVIVWSHPGSRTTRYRAAAEIAAALATLRWRAGPGRRSAVSG